VSGLDGMEAEMSGSRGTVSAGLSLGLVRPGQVVVPLMASLHYSRSDPYAVRMAFHVGTDEPVEWALARDLLAAALHGREGIGDVQAWPSSGPAGSAAGEETSREAAGPALLNIAMTSPFGHAQFEAPAAPIAAFLDRTYRIVPPGQESDHLDLDAELALLLSQEA
jgi:Streptomyces sporulation and cell division protein, SsgA